jgi:superfamily I DNA/RNA helicase
MYGAEVVGMVERIQASALEQQLREHKQRVQSQEFTRSSNGKQGNTHDGNVVTLSTVHKAKGLEFEVVVMAGDFASLFDSVSKISFLDSLPLHYLYAHPYAHMYL